MNTVESLDVKALTNGQQVNWKIILSMNEGFFTPRYDALVAPFSSKEIIILGGLNDQD